METGSHSRALRNAASGPSADRGAARIRVLDRDARRLLELEHQLQRSVGVDDVVVRELLALQHARRRDVGPRGVGVTIKRRALMRILPVAQRLNELPLPVHRAPELVFATTEIIGDHAIVGRRRRKGFPGELAPPLRRHRSVASQILQHRPVIRGIDDDDHVLVILRSRANHRWTADVDVLDRLLEVAAASRHRSKWVEVDANEIDRIDGVRLHLLAMSVEAATSEDAAVNARVEGFHPPVEDLRRSGVLGDVGHRNSGGAQRARRSTRREDLRAELGESAREVDDAGLVTDAEKRPLDRAAQGYGLPPLGSLPRLATRPATNPRADARDQLVGDGASLIRHALGGGRLSPHRRARPALHGGNVGHVHHHVIHAHTSDDGRHGPREAHGPAVRQDTRIAVGVAATQRRDEHPPLRSKRMAIANPFAGANLGDTDDTGLERHDRVQRRDRPKRLRGVEPVQHQAGAHHVEVGGRSAHHRRAIGQVAADPDSLRRQRRGDKRQALELAVGDVGGDRFRHGEVRADGYRGNPGRRRCEARQLDRFGRRQAEAVHSRVDLDVDASIAAGPRPRRRRAR